MVICLVFYLLTFFVFLMFLRRFIRNAPHRLHNLLVVLMAPVLYLVYYLLSSSRLPATVFDLDLFSPDLFARSAILPSLGDLFFLTVIAFFIIYNFYMDFQFRLPAVKKLNPASVLLFAVAGILAMLLYLLNIFVFKSIIVDSTISFEAYKVLTLSVYTFIGLLILALQFTTFALVTDKVFSVLQLNRNRRAALVFMIAIDPVDRSSADCSPEIDGES